VTVVRWRRRAFKRSSSSLTLRLTVDFGIPSCAAAVVKLPACTTRANTSISFKSMRHCSISSAVGLRRGEEEIRRIGRRLRSEGTI
jgi:hypothetical protein